MWNISNFMTFPQRRRLMMTNGLMDNDVYSEADAGPDQEPGKFPAKVFTAGVLCRSDENWCKCVLNLLQLEDILFEYTM